MSHPNKLLCLHVDDRGRLREKVLIDNEVRSFWLADGIVTVEDMNIRYSVEDRQEVNDVKIAWANGYAPLRDCDKCRHRFLCLTTRER